MKSGKITMNAECNEIRKAHTFSEKYVLFLYVSVLSDALCVAALTVHIFFEIAHFFIAALLEA